ncbi:MAG: fatty acid--CoA ligase family protein [Pseudomonadota bacterium]
MVTPILYPTAEQTVDRLLEGPVFQDRPFVTGKTFKDVFAMARSIVHSCPPGMNRQELLGVCTEDRAAIAAAILASLAGGPILVFPSDISDAALKDLKTSTGLTRVLADPARTLPDGISAVPLEPVQGPLADKPLKRSIAMDEPLLKLFTGGSTGKPVIWSKTATNIVSEAGFHVLAHRLTPDDVVLATVPPYHIYGLLFSVAAPLMAGASVVNQPLAFPHEIIDAVQKNAATILVSVPAHYKALKGHEFGRHCLRFALSSAGTLDPEDEAAFRTLTGTPVVEVYGSTETGGIAFRCRARGEDCFTPFDRIEARITDNDLRIRSPFVSPEIGLDDQGFYLAQDRVEPRSGGAFALLGRTDTIVKVGGKRVDLDHVKTVLKQMPGVRDALVYARAIPTGREFDIHALIEGDCARSGIRAFLADQLEAVARPRRFRIVDKMPMTRAGKYDRSAIEALFAADRDE